MLGRGGGVDITPTLPYAMVTLEVACHVSMRSGTGAPPRSAVTAKSVSGALTMPRGFCPLIAPQILGAAMVSRGVVADRPSVMWFRLTNQWLTTG